MYKYITAKTKKIRSKLKTRRTVAAGEKPIERAARPTQVYVYVCVAT